MSAGYRLRRNFPAKSFLVIAREGLLLWNCRFPHSLGKTSKRCMQSIRSPGVCLRLIPPFVITFHMDHIDERAQEALFRIEGPDEDGCVWACSIDGKDVWSQNLGPAIKVAEVFLQWLGAVHARPVNDP